MQLVYRQLLDNEVDEKYANQIIGEIESGLKKESNIDSILAGIYQKIILKLGQPKVIEAEEKKTKIERKMENLNLRLNIQNYHYL